MYESIPHYARETFRADARRRPEQLVLTSPEAA